MRTVRIENKLRKAETTFPLCFCHFKYIYFLTFQTFIKYFTVLILITQEMLLKFYYTG